MQVCLICGKQHNKYICNDCKSVTDIEKLCEEIISYTPGLLDNPDANTIWETIAETLENKNQFRRIAFELAEEIDSPRKMYHKIHSVVGEYISVSRTDKEWFYEVYEKLDWNVLSESEQFRIKGLMLEALYMDYRYFEADELASELVEMVELPWQTAVVLADFYNKTRRYDAVEQIIGNITPGFVGNQVASNQFSKILEANFKYRAASECGKKEYIPNPREDKDRAVSSYIDFMATLGIDVDKPCEVPKPIPWEEYPVPLIIKEPNFDNFVAFDFETTGFSPTADCIIEVGAVKVVNGEETIFSEFVKPFKKRLSSKIMEITGITEEDLKNARPMWEVISDFIDFIGDNVLVGYNSANFDSRFLARAGRYCNRGIENPHFDVLQYAKRIKDSIGYNEENLKLSSIAKFCGIENPQAHRAWADALTTARVYQKLKEKDSYDRCS